MLSTDEQLYWENKFENLFEGQIIKNPDYIEGAEHKDNPEGTTGVKYILKPND